MATASAKPKTLEQLKNTKGTLYAKNLLPSAVSANERDLQFMLEPAGSEGSVKVLPKRVLEVSGFIKLWMRGAIQIGTEFEEEALASANRVDYDTQARLDAIAAMTEENSSDKDVVQKECLISKELVFQTVQDEKNLVPPLAERYKDRAHEFSPTQVQTEDGTVVTKFNRVQIG